jgi:chromosome segregation ATPase
MTTTGSQSVDRVQEAMAALEAAMSAAVAAVHVRVNAAVAAAAEVEERTAQARAALPELNAQVAAKQADVNALELRRLAIDAQVKSTLAQVAQLEAQAAR